MGKPHECIAPHTDHYGCRVTSLRKTFMSIAVKGLLLLPLSLSASQIPHTFTMGAKPDNWKDQLSDISNKQSWEETRFLFAKPQVFLGKPAESTELGFWNNRLFEVKFTLTGNRWNEVRQALDKAYGDVWALHVTSAEKSGQWGTPKNRVLVNEYGGKTDVTFTDDAQKEFHFTDLFRGVLLYIILAIAGLFILNYSIVTILNRYCRKCGSFAMELKTITRENVKDYSTDLFDRDFHSDQVYAFHCKKCGHVRKERYTGLWSFIRSQNA